MAIRRDALAAHREALGFTQETLAQQLGVEPSTAGRWERGTLTPQPWRRPDMAKALKLSLEELDRLLNPPAPQVVASSPLSGESVESFTALNVGQQHHVDAALANARRYFDGPVVSYFRRQLDICMANDGEYGPTQTLPAVLHLLGAVDQHGREVRPAVRRDLLSFAACGAEFAGWLYRDANDPIEARFWYDRATEWAQEAGDLLMQGYVMLKKSQMAYDARDALRVFMLAQAALEGPWRLSTRIRAEVTQQVALGMTMCGEPLPAVERKLDDARELLAEAATDDEQPGLPGAYFTDTTLMLRTATAFIEAGKPARSALMFDEVLANADLSRRDAGFFRARRATALALSGEPDEAATVGLESVEMATATDSRRTLRVLADMMGTLAPWRGRPLVRELQDAIAASGGSAD